MKQHIGTKVPTTAQVAALQRRIDDITDDLDAFSVALSDDERHRALKPRRGGERIVHLVGRIVDKYGVVLPDLSVDQMTANLELADNLFPLAMAARRLDQRIADTILQAKSDYWSAMTAYYSTLVRLSGDNVSIANAIEPAVEFFATGPRKRVA